MLVEGMCSVTTIITHYVILLVTHFVSPLYSEKESQRLSTTKRTFPKLGILELGLLNELRKVKFEEGTSPKLEKVIIEDCHSDLTICGISSLQSLKEILHFTRRKLVKVDRRQATTECGDTWQPSVVASGAEPKQQL